MWRAPQRGDGVGVVKGKPGEIAEGDIVHCIVEFPAAWIDGDRFEAALQGSSGPHGPRTLQVTFRLPVGCKIMVDGAIRLLSLAKPIGELEQAGRSAI